MRLALDADLVPTVGGDAPAQVKPKGSLGSVGSGCQSGSPMALAKRGVSPNGSPEGHALNGKLLTVLELDRQIGVEFNLWKSATHPRSWKPLAARLGAAVPVDHAQCRRPRSCAPARRKRTDDERQKRSASPARKSTAGRSALIRRQIPGQNQ